MTENHLAQGIIILACAITLWRMGRNLPAQNVVACAGLCVLMSGAIEIIGTLTGVPFGPFFYTENLGPLLFRVLPWPIPLLWFVVLLTSRGVARLILKPWRGTSNHGLWSIALTCLLAVLFDAALEPCGARVNRWWVWTLSRTRPVWYGAPWINFAGWAVSSLFILGLVTPFLINKKPAEEPPPDIYPLALWAALMLLLAIGNAAEHLWAGAALAFTVSALAMFFAWRNSRA
jgi:uncharacterized membrane protein